MKYVVVLPDGVADVPIKELGGKTPLEVAKHPNMDWIAREGITGWARTIPRGFPPGSDVGCMSVFGYDPRKYHTGRSPLEAAAQGIMLGQSEVAFRCNTVAVEHGVMADYSAGHIESADSSELIKTVNEQLGRDGIRFYAGVSYRHLAIVDGGQWTVDSGQFAQTMCTPPHDISGKPIAAYLPSGPGAERLRQIMQESVHILNEHPVNQRRVKAGKKPATMLWFWGQGTATQLPPFQQTYGLRGACISAVDIVRGIGRLAGCDIIQVPGITGYFDTNYKGKAEYALRALDDHDLVLVHIEPTDEAGHMGDVRKKIQAIEDTDRLVVGTLLEGLKRRGEPFAILVVCDHPTSTILKTHLAEPVPFALYATDGPKDEVSAYHEVAVNASRRRFDDGFQLMAFFLNQQAGSV
ncbi:MAG: cofactor-independent phosphoglycerate mutase [Candidatus Omnitrophota bacterium]|nr:cofactor-independent phosphoglycerate mutase [Candidatus Omnitrophota bacterium]